MQKSLNIANIKLALISVIGLLVVLVTLIVPSAYAFESDWFSTKESKLRVISAGVDEKGQATLGLEYQLADGWKTYWRYAGDSGAPTVLTVENAENLSDVTLHWPTPKRLMEDFGQGFSIQSFIYEHEVILPITAKVDDTAKDASATFYVSYAVCEEVCIPHETSFDITIPAGHKDEAVAEKIAAYQAKVPSVHSYGDEEETKVEGYELIQTKAGNEYIHIQVRAKHFADGMDVFVEGEQNIRFTEPIIYADLESQQADIYIPMEKLLATAGILGKQLQITIANGQDSVEMSVRMDEAVEGVIPGETQENSATEGSSANIFLMILYGIIGGLILNIMPCVLPVLSMKLLSIVKHGGGHEKEATYALLASAAGIILSFLAIAAITIGLQSAGRSIGWGIQFQEPSFIIALIIIVVLFACNLWGKFEINLPVWLGGKVSDVTHEHHGSLSGHFVTGVFATLLATPCTAPFLGVSVSFALSHGVGEIIAIFLAMGVGMALPYIVFAIFPKLVTRLPKPGAWMVTVKKFLGVLLLLTAFWLLWVLAGQLGNAPAVIVALLCLLLKFWLEQKEGVLAKRPLRWALAIITVMAVFYLPIELQQREAAVEAKAEALWQPFDEARIYTLVREGKVVFVDITADWCTTCGINKFFVLNRSGAMEALSADDVVAMQADITNPDEAVTRYMNARGQYGIPYNVVYGPNAPEGIALPTILSTSNVVFAIKQAR